MINYETVQVMLELHRKGTYIYLTDEGWLELIRSVKIVETDSENEITLEQIAQSAI
nr:hypothetical protein [Mycobacterium sp. E3298]